MLSFAGAVAAASADPWLQLAEGEWQPLLQASCRQRSNTPVSRNSWLDDAHLDVACRELRKRLRCKSIVILTPILVEAWLRTKDKDLGDRISDAEHVKRFLIPVSDDILLNGGSHWTLLVVKKEKSGAGRIHQSCFAPQDCSLLYQTAFVQTCQSQASLTLLTN